MRRELHKKPSSGIQRNREGTKNEGSERGGNQSLSMYAWVISLRLIFDRKPR